ncbi:MAG: type II toxin-antitoxin system RelE/ParE family toxin [Deltaproteobacteria bacterium]|nr:type II toxin-antitoxin system RelE/ParE family toxin [Deltaproteobacteria bacterium]
MAQLIWTEPALLHLDEIAEYIALDDFRAAQRLVEKVFKRAALLEQFPEPGRRPPELKRTPYREIVIGPCRIFYRVEDDRVYMLYVMRAERLLRKYLLEERNRKKAANVL